MDVREKLVEMLNEVQETGVNEIPAGFGCNRDYVRNEKVASHLISHGVTVQEWISVKDRLPEIYDKDSDWSGTVLFRTTQGHIHSGRRKFGRHRMSFWIDESDNLFFSKEEVTHWMPLPQPPKGE